MKHRTVLIVAAIYSCSILTVLLFSEALEVATAFLVFFVVATTAFFYQAAGKGLLTWGAGIPGYYLLLFFLLPLLEQVLGLRDFTKVSGVTEGLYVASGGIVAFLVANRVALFPSTNDRNAALSIANAWPLAELNRVGVAVLLAIISVASILYSIQYGYFGLIPTEGTENPWLGVLATASGLLEIVLAVAWFHYLTLPRRVAWAAIAWFSLIVLLISGLFAVSKSAVLRPIAIVVLTRFIVRREIPYVLLSVGLLAYVFIAFPVVAGFRALTNVAEVPRIEVLTATIDYLSDLRISDLMSLQQANIGGETSPLAGVSRSLLVVYSTIVHQTGGSHPYLDGESYVVALGTLVPRLLWEDKPAMNIGNFIGHQYDLLVPTDIVTNISPSQLGEAYMNFGLIGVLVAMVFWGYLARWIDSHLTAANNTWLIVIAFMMVAFQEAAVAHALSPLLKFVILLVAVLIVISCVRKAVAMLAPIHLPPPSDSTPGPPRNSWST